MLLQRQNHKFKTDSLIKNKTMFVKLLISNNYGKCILNCKNIFKKSNKSSAAYRVNFNAARFLIIKHMKSQFQTKHEGNYELTKIIMIKRAKNDMYDFYCCKTLFITYFNKCIFRIHKKLIQAIKRSKF